LEGISFPGSRGKNFSAEFPPLFLRANVGIGNGKNAELEIFCLFPRKFRIVPAEFFRGKLAEKVAEMETPFSRGIPAENTGGKCAELGKPTFPGISPEIHTTISTLVFHIILFINQY
jgi:hypothetical protein